MEIASSPGQAHWYDFEFCLKFPTLQEFPNVTEIESLRVQLREFAASRDWGQYHSPKNLAMALLVEAAELLETFQWLSEEQSRKLAPEALAAASDEVADVLLYLIRLRRIGYRSDSLGQSENPRERQKISRAQGPRQ
jgi:NTP pyrophosphatase (non-canonical NTP hydrolase)